MKCRQCGSEIADKALVCYRCGTAATEPKFKAPASRRTNPRFGIVPALVVVLLLLCALYLMQFTTGAPPVLRWAIVVVAAAIVAIRIGQRRSRL
jgi:hypothetical protein